MTNKRLKEAEDQELTAGQRVCFDRGYHDDEEFIDPRSGVFLCRCKDCKRDMDCEESEEW